MFKELRPGMESTPETWAANFLDRRSRGSRGTRHLTLSLDRRWRMIRERVAPGGRVLDAGCGLGDWVTFLSARGYRATGVDYSQALVDTMLREQPSAHWVQSDIRAMPFEEGAFDAVVSWGVVEHEEEGPSRALKEFCRVLAPGGWAFVTVPLDTPAMRASSDWHFAKPGRAKTFFQYMYTGAELGDLMRDAGFSVEVLQPISAHYAILSPSLYHWVAQQNATVQRLIQPPLQLWAHMHGGADGMVIAVAQKR
jgi:ubiquinone/menaquinone biosynthesis C-methylase UbiE